MIKNVGYTDDGLIFITATIDQGGGPQGDIVMQMTKQRAAEIQGWLKKAIDSAPMGVIKNVRNSPNTDKSKPPGDKRDSDRGNPD